MTTPCRNRAHSPRLHGTTWTCPDCTAGTAPSPLAAALAARDEAMARATQPASKIPDHERALFVSAVRQVARGGVVRQNDVRPLVRGRIYHKHIGALWSWAVASGLLTELDREQSNDSAGRNTHHDAGVYHLGAAA